MRVVCISDTHSNHLGVVLPPGDLLIHAGDLTGRGSLLAIQQAKTWLESQLEKYPLGVIVIAGNHELTLDEEHSEYYMPAKGYMENSKFHYLLNSGMHLANGMNVWGSPATPAFCGWAFNREGDEIERDWNMIPDNTNILITHGPAFGTLDKSYPPLSPSLGCPRLVKHLKRLTNLKLHVFGHIHGGHGITKDSDYYAVNASVLNEQYKMVNQPIVVEI